MKNSNCLIFAFLCVLCLTPTPPSPLNCCRCNFSSPIEGKSGRRDWERNWFFTCTYFVCYDKKDREKQSSRKSYRNGDVSEFLLILLCSLEVPWTPTYLLNFITFVVDSYLYSLFWAIELLNISSQADS